MCKNILLTFLILSHHFIALGQHILNDLVNLGPYDARQRSISLLIDQSNTNKWFLGTDGGGLWVSDNAGNTWNPKDLLNNQGLKIYDIEQDENDPSIICYSAPGYTSTGSTVQNSGLYLSTNGGETFSHLIGQKNFEKNLKIVDLDIVNSKIFFQSLSGVYRVNRDGSYETIYAGNPYRSEIMAINDNEEAVLITESKSIKYGDNQTRTFVDVLSHSDASSCDIGYSANNPNIVYAVFAFDNLVKLLYKSEEYGKPGTWDIVYDRRGSDNFSDDFTGNLYWQSLFILAGQAGFEGIVVDEDDPDTIFLSSTDLYYSNNGGTNWLKKKQSSQQVSFGDMWPNSIVRNPANDKILIGHDHGLFEGSVNDFFTLSDSESISDDIQDKTSGIFAFTAYAGDHLDSGNTVVVGSQDRGAWLIKESNEIFVGGGDTYHALLSEDYSFVFNKHGGDLIIKYDHNGDLISRFPFDENLETYVGYNQTVKVGNLIVYADDYYFSSKGSNIITIDVNANMYDLVYEADEHNVITSIAGAGDHLVYFIEWNSNSDQKTLKSYSIQSGDVTSIMNFSYPINDVNEIEVNNSNNEVLFCYANGSGTILQKINLSTSTTMSILGDLPSNVEILSLASCNEKIILLGTNNGIYFTVNGGENWIKEQKFPTVEIFDIDFRNTDSTLFAFTYGRGALKATVDVTNISQTITFDALAAVTFGDADFNLGAAASSRLEVSYTSSDPSVTSVAGNRVTIAGAGTTTITALQAGNINYIAAPDVTQSLVVNKTDQTIDLAPVGTKGTIDAPFEVAVSSTSGLSVTLTVSGSATISGTTLTLEGTEGIVTITADQAGNSNYNAAPSVEESFDVTLITGLKEEAPDKIILHPIPANNTIYIDMGNQKLLEMTVTDLSGKQLAVNAKDTRLDISSLKQGYYILRITTDQGVFLKKIIKQ